MHRRFLPIILSASAFSAGTAAWSQYFNPINSWERYTFDLPENKGVVALDVRMVNQLMHEYQYRLHTNCNGYAFECEPSLQPEGAPNLRLDWVDRSDRDGPFIKITHDVKRFDGSKTEICDLMHGVVYRDGDKSLGALKRRKATLIGYLDKDCNFKLASGRKVRHEIVGTQ